MKLNIRINSLQNTDLIKQKSRLMHNAFASFSHEKGILRLRNNIKYTSELLL